MVTAKYRFGLGGVLVGVKLPYIQYLKYKQHGAARDPFRRQNGKHEGRDEIQSWLPKVRRLLTQAWPG